jgi:homoaconitase/3-isopropylmalate dehydratase large subunit
MFDKIWDRHRVLEREDGQTLLYVDRHLLHDGTAPLAAFQCVTRVSRSCSASTRAASSSCWRHPHNIAARVQIVVEHFRQNIAHLLAARRRRWW